MDILQPLPLEQWTLLRNSLRRDWPMFAYEFNYVNNAIKWKIKNPHLKLQIYCPDGKYESGLFISIGSYALYFVFIFAFEESKHLIKHVLAETKAIDWNNDVLFACIHESIKMSLYDTLIELQKPKKFELEFSVTTDYYFKSKEDCAKFEVEVPEECELKHLDESHIPLIHSLWPHRSLRHPELSTKYLTTMVKLNRGLGFFLKKDNSLVSWILHTEIGGLGMLQTLDEHKGKGYGKNIVKAIAKELAIEENLDSVLFIVENNTPSIKIFESLDYSRITKATWITLKANK